MCRDPDLKIRPTECLAVNAVGSALVAEAFRPLLLRSNDPFSVYASSGAGSIHRNMIFSSGKFVFDEAHRASTATWYAEFDCCSRERGIWAIRLVSLCYVIWMRGVRYSED